MDESTLNVEGTGAAAGASGNANPDASPQSQPSIDGQAEQLLSLLKPMLASQVEELTKPYLSQLEGLKKVQGDIDRSRTDLKAQLAEINRLTKSGLTQEQAVEHLDKQNAESAWRQSLESQLADLKSLITGNSQGQANTVANVFQQYGLDPKDARIAPLLTKQYANKTEMEMAALKAFHQIQTSPQPSAAQNASMQGGAGNRSKTKDISTVNDPSTLYGLAEQELLG